MAQVVAESQAVTRPWGRLRLLPAIVASMVVGVALGYLGWTLPSVGSSLLVPTVIVFGVGAATATASWIVAGIGSWRRQLRVFSVLVSSFTVMASIWTFEFALPASLAWNLGATHTAQTVLLKLRDAPGFSHGVAPYPGCMEVTTGSIGPLEAPYSECPLWTNVGHSVSFRGDRGGLTYTDSPATTFEDQCIRHLVGEWWMFAPESNDMGGCPFGYHFSGAG
jgi:hypothetical protein